MSEPGSATVSSTPLPNYPNAAEPAESSGTRCFAVRIHPLLLMTMKVPADTGVLEEFCLSRGHVKLAALLHAAVNMNSPPPLRLQ